MSAVVVVALAAIVLRVNETRSPANMNEAWQCVGLSGSGGDSGEGEKDEDRAAWMEFGVAGSKVDGGRLGMLEKMTFGFRLEEAASPKKTWLNNWKQLLIFHTISHEIT